MKTIKDMPEHSRPREKLQERGASALTDEGPEQSMVSGFVSAFAPPGFAFCGTLRAQNTARRRNAAAIGLINLIYNLARCEQIVRLKLRPRIAA